MKLDPERRKTLVASVRRYLDEELETEVGELKAGLFLDYVLEEVGPVVYNHAIKDAQAFFLGKVEDLEGSCYEPEMQYWPARDRERGPR